MYSSFFVAASEQEQEWNDDVALKFTLVALEITILGLTSEITNFLLKAAFISFFNYITYFSIFSASVGSDFVNNLEKLTLN